MGCTLQQYGHAKKAIDLSGLLLIVKLSVGSVRVCTYIAPHEFQGTRTNGVTATASSPTAQPLAAAYRRKGAAGYHTPFAPESAVPKSRRVSEITVEEEDNVSVLEGSVMEGTQANGGSGNVGSASGWEDDNAGNAYYTGPPRKIQWSSTALLKESSTETANEGGAESAKPGASAREDPKEDIAMCVLESPGAGTDKFLNLCVIMDFPDKAAGVSVEAVDVQCALGPMVVTIGEIMIPICVLCMLV